MNYEDLIFSANSEHLLLNMISEDILGWFTLLIISLITFLFIKQNPQTKSFLITALFLRSFCVVIDQYFFNLPGSMRDGWTFELFAFNYSQEYGLSIIFDLFNGDSYMLPKLISILYTLTDTRSPMMANMISVGFGTATVYLIYRLTLTIWDDQVAIKAGWFASCFPSLVLYSAIMMREIYVVFFLTYALIACVNFINKNKFIYFVKLTSGFFLASLFHGPIVLGFLFFLIYLCFDILRKNNYFLRFKKKKLYTLLLIPLFLTPIITYLLGFYSIPKIGNIKNFGDIKNENNIQLSLKDRLIWKINKATRATIYINKKRDIGSGSQFPSWTIPTDINDLIYLTPIRMTYFLYSPFPWDIKRVSHLLGLLDSILYIFLSFCILRNRKILYENPKTRFLVLILFIYIVIYSFGVGNFGTSIRHRVKFVEIIIAIAAPVIARIRFSKIKLN